jgi:asparagine N-glycosylation enzyme membrane subunit Stt3
VKGTAIGLALISFVAFGLRSFFLIPVVFGYGYTNFIETDAWNRMLYANKILAMPLPDAISYTIHNNLLFSFIVAQLGKVFPIETVGAWLPPVIAVLTVVVVYFVGKELFNKPVGFMAALFIAVMPGEYLHRTLLGFADHHALEVLLICLLILFAVKALKSATIFSRWSVLAGISFFLYSVNYKNGLYLIGIIFIVTVIYLLATKQFKPLATLGIAGLIGLIIYLPVGGYERLLFLFPGSESAAAITTGEAIDTFFTPVNKRTINELMPLLFPYGSFDPVVLISNLHLFTITCLMAIPFLWKYRHDKAIILLIIWTLVILILTLNTRRFLYYLVINVALLSSFAVYEFGKRFKGKLLSNATILLIPLLVFSLPMAKSMSSSADGSMQPEWHDALLALKRMPDKGKVTAWIDFGHWIEYVAEKPASYLPGPGGEIVAKIFLTSSDSEAKDLLDELDTGYLIVDIQTITKRTYALETYAGFKPPDDAATMGYRLLAKKNIPPYLTLVYESPNIRIYARK